VNTLHFISTAEFNKTRTAGNRINTATNSMKKLIFFLLAITCAGTMFGQKKLLSESFQKDFAPLKGANGAIHKAEVVFAVTEIVSWDLSFRYSITVNEDKETLNKYVYKGKTITSSDPSWPNTSPARPYVVVTISIDNGPQVKLKSVPGVPAVRVVKFEDLGVKISGIPTFGDQKPIDEMKQAIQNITVVSVECWSAAYPIFETMLTRKR